MWRPRRTAKMLSNNAIYECLMHFSSLSSTRFFVSQPRMTRDWPACLGRWRNTTCRWAAQSRGAKYCEHQTLPRLAGSQISPRAWRHWHSIWRRPYASCMAGTSWQYVSKTTSYHHWIKYTTPGFFSYITSTIFACTGKQILSGSRCPVHIFSQSW